MHDTHAHAEDVHAIQVRGMHCKHCEMLVTLELEDAGAHDVVANAETGEVTYKGSLSHDAVAQAVRAAGFELQN